MNKINNHIRSEQKHCARRRSRITADMGTGGFGLYQRESEIELADRLIDIIIGGGEHLEYVCMQAFVCIIYVLLKTDEFLSLFHT